MSQKIQVAFIDDLDGSEAVGTVSFALDGTAYEIDLSKKHTAELNAALAPFISSARKTTSAGRRKGAVSSNGSKRNTDTAAIRDWAAGQGISLKSRGRVPADVVEKYRAAVG